MILLIKFLNLNQLQPFIAAELYAVAPLIMDTADLRKTWASHQNQDYNMTRGNMQNDLCLIFKVTGEKLWFLKKKPGQDDVLGRNVVYFWTD